MNVLDILIILGFLGFILASSLRQPIRQVSVSLGALAGLLIGSWAYKKLAFLATGSGHRALILGLLVVAIGLLAYDALLNLFLLLSKQFGFEPRKATPHLRQRIISGGIAGVTGFIVLWLTIGIFSTFPLTIVRQQLDSSRIVAAVENSTTVPSIFRGAAKLLNPFGQPKAFASVEPTFSDTSVNVAVGDAYSSLDAVVAKDSASVPKVNAWGCGSTSIGSSFLISKRAVVTNAHVIAGANRISVQDASGTYTAQVILFDPSIDVAILETSVNLPEAPLKFNTALAGSGSIASVLGYPQGGSFMAGDAIVLQSLAATGYDIYGQAKVTRTIYALRANIVPGNSGGPLLDDTGKVLGLIFGNSTTQNRTGYAIAASQIAPEITKALATNNVVSSGECTP